MNKIFRVSVGLISLSPLNAIAQSDNESLILERNSIESSGDNAYNLIATSGAEIVIYFDENQQPVSRNKSQVLNEISPKIIDSVSSAFPSQSKDFIALIALAHYSFDKGQYSTASVLFDKVLRFLPRSNEHFEEIRGKVTASLYGSKRHLKGLQFICDQYSTRPSWDFRYRHAIHAHLRSLAVSLGHEEAEKILSFVRRDPKCRRPDFSPAWIPIHLQDMRAMERSVPPIGSKYGLSTDGDKAYANNLLGRSDVPFIDYLYYVMGRYKNVVDEFPESYVYDLALLGVGEFGSYEDAKSALLEYIGRFDRYEMLAAQMLFRRAIDENDKSTREELLQKFGSSLVIADRQDGIISFQIGRFKRVWFQHEEIKELNFEQLGLITEFFSKCTDIAPQLKAGEFGDVLSFLKVSRQRHRSLFPDETYAEAWFGEYPRYENNCDIQLWGAYLDALIALLEPIVDSVEKSDIDALMEIGRSIKTCADLREGYAYLVKSHGGGAAPPICRELLHLWNEDKILAKQQRKVDSFFAEGGKVDHFSLHRLAAAIFNRIYEVSPYKGSRALFLSALCYKNNGDYSEFVERMMEYSTQFPEEEFADDALAELGWYYLSVKGETEKAEGYFRQVVDDYADANAYDNALNWLVIVSRSRGELIAASEWAARLLVAVASDRLKSKTSARDHALLRLEEIAESETSVFAIWEEVPKSLSFFGARANVYIEKKGDSETRRVLEVGGVSVSNLFVFASELLKFKDAGEQFIEMSVEDERTGEVQMRVEIAELGVRI